MIQTETLGTKVSITHGSDSFCGDSLTVQCNCGISVKEDHDLFRDMPCSRYLEDRLIGPDGHPGTEFVTLQEAHKRF